MEENKWLGFLLDVLLPFRRFLKQLFQALDFSLNGRYSNFPFPVITSSFKKCN
jgi:hypothetical protein